jgi:hypothetical protein
VSGVKVEAVENEFDILDETVVVKQVRVTVGRDSVDLDPDEAHNLMVELSLALFQVEDK